MAKSNGFFLLSPLWSSKSDSYHYCDCSRLKKSNQEIKLWIDTKNEAKKIMSENFTFWRKQKRKIKYCNHNIGKIVKLKVHNDFSDFGCTNNIFVDCTWMFYQKYWNVLFNPRNSHFNSNSIKLSKEWSKERGRESDRESERERERTS